MPREKKERTTDYDKVLPRRLRYLMNKKRTTQAELGEAIKKSRQSVSYYCDGSVSPDWETIVSIAKYFHVTSDYLLGISRTETNNKDVSAIGDYTGLDPNSIEILHDLRGSRVITYLDNLIEPHGLQNLNNLIFETWYCHNIATSRKWEYDEPVEVAHNGTVTLSPWDSYMFFSNEAESQARMCCQEALNKVLPDKIKLLMERDKVMWGKEASDAVE